MEGVDQPMQGVDVLREILETRERCFLDREMTDSFEKSPEYLCGFRTDMDDRGGEWLLHVGKKRDREGWMDGCVKVLSYRGFLQFLLEGREGKGRGKKVGQEGRRG